MRTLIACLVTAVLAAALGCASGKDSRAVSSSGTSAVESGAARSCVMRSGGRAVLRLTVAPDVTCTPEAGSLNLQWQNLRIDVWSVPGAQSVDDAVGRIGRVIESEFKDFKPASTSSLTIAGSPATRLTGPGAEADDGDPGTADIVVFRVGGRVFVACTHEEHLSPVAQQWMLTVVGTAQQP